MSKRTRWVTENSPEHLDLVRMGWLEDGHHDWDDGLASVRFVMMIDSGHEVASRLICSCCVCHGIHCFLFHPGHDHRFAEDLDDVYTRLEKLKKQLDDAKHTVVENEDKD